MSTRRSPLRAFAGRYAVAFVTSAVVMVGAVVAVNYVIDRKLSHVARVNVDTASAPSQGANYLVIGSDTRAFVDNPTQEDAFGDKSQTGGQRSDTMMVVHVEPGQQRTLVVSFPRDLFVNIPGVGQSKINAAFNSGPDKVIETLKSNFGVEINHYIEVDFKSFEGVVRAIGNVPVYFPYSARDQKTGLFIYQPGCVRLNGPASLAYVRSRGLEYYSEPKAKWVSADAVPDIDRIARQQDFIRRMAGLAVAKSLNDPLAANDIADRVLENLKVDDNLTKDDILALIDAFRTINPNDSSALNFQTFPWQGGPRQGGLDVLYPKDPDWRTLVAQLGDFSGSGAHGPSINPGDVKVRVLNGSGQDGVAASALKELKKLGFQGSGSSNDPRGTVQNTEIRYRPQHADQGRAMLKYVSPAARLVSDPTLKGADVAVVLGADFKAIVRAGSGAGTTTSSTTTPGGAPQQTPAPSTGPTQIANSNQLGDPAPKNPPC